MTTPVQIQLDELARRVRALEEELERRGPVSAQAAPEPPVVAGDREAASGPAAAPSQPWPKPQPRPAPPASPPARPAPRPKPQPVDLEALLGGRLFAWIGGVAVVIGVVFFVATAIHNGWIGEGLRVALAFIGSTALFAAGAWLHERKDRTQASLLMIGAGVAALYASLTAGTNTPDEPIFRAPIA